MFRSIIELAPMQVYSSALLFSPRQSVIRQNYKALLPAWAESRIATEDTWGAAIHTLEGHSDWVRSVVFSHDSKLIASGSNDRTVRIWDATTGVCASVIYNVASSCQLLRDVAIKSFGSWTLFDIAAPQAHTTSSSAIVSYTDLGIEPNN